MGLSFRNDTRDGLYLAYLRWDPPCRDDGGEPFSGHGWYRIEPAETREVCRGAVGDWHRWWGFTALSDNGQFWGGQYGMTVPTSAFAQCYGVGTSAELPPGTRQQATIQIGFRGILMDDDYNDYLLALVD